MQQATQIKKWLPWVLTAAMAAVLVVTLLHHPAPRPKGPAGPAQALQAIVSGYRPNRSGDIDKMMITADGKNVAIHFAPFMAKPVMQLAPAGSTVQLIIQKNMPGPAANGGELLQVKNDLDSLRLTRLPPSSPGRPVTISNAGATLHLDDKGITTGFSIGGYLIELPPHAKQNINSLIKPSSAIVVKGYERTGGGFVNVTGLVLVRPYSISIDNTEYLL